MTGELLTALALVGALAGAAVVGAYRRRPATLPCRCDPPAPWLVFDANGPGRWCGQCGGGL